MNRFLKASKNFLKEKWPELLLIFSALVICIVHAYPAGADAYFNPINGDFQNYNVVRRFLAGQTPFKDFAVYLGYGHLAVGSLLTFLFGKGDPDLMTSKMAFQFAAISAFAIFVYVVFRAVFNKKNRLVPLIAVNVSLLLLILNPNIFANVLSINQEFYEKMQCALTSGNSARFLRQLAPAIYVIMCFALNFIKDKVAFLKKADILSTAFVFGIPAGIIFYYSNDYGVASIISITLILFIAILFNKEPLLKKALRFSAYIGATAVSFLLFGLIITKGHISSYISSTFGTGGAQGWYYLSSKSYYFWDIDLSFWVCLQALIVLTYLIVLIVKGFTKENAIRYGIPMFLNMVAYAGTNEYKLLSGGIIHEVSYTILYLTVVAELIALLSRFAASNKVNVIRFSKKLLAVFVAVIGLTWSFSSCFPQIIKLKTANRANYVENVGYFTNDFLSKSILSTDEFLKDDDVLFSTYASGLETYRNEYQPSGTDYIIHAMGYAARENYMNSLKETNPDYITTIRSSYNGWEYWIRNADWYFYRNLYKNYKPAYATGYQMFWDKRNENTDFSRSDAKIKVNKLDKNKIQVVVYAPGVTLGMADVQLKYSVEKTKCLRSLLTFNTMLMIENKDSFAITNDVHDELYYLAGQGDGSENSTIGIPIINGKGSVTLTSQPVLNTKLKKFHATLGDVFCGDIFDSIAVKGTFKDGDKYTLTTENSPENGIITQNASCVIIGDEKYDAEFSLSEDRNSIIITINKISKEADEILIGHSYYPVIRVG